MNKTYVKTETLEKSVNLTQKFYTLADVAALSNLSLSTIKRDKKRGHLRVSGLKSVDIKSWDGHSNKGTVIKRKVIVISRAYVMNYLHYLINKRRSYKVEILASVN